MKNVRVNVRENRCGNYWDFGIYEGKKILMVNYNRLWLNKKVATRNAKAMAKRIGIKFDPEIVKQHGC